MIRKMLAGLLALAMACLLVACGSGGSDAPAADKSDPAENAAQEPSGQPQESTQDDSEAGQEPPEDEPEMEDQSGGVLPYLANNYQIFAGMTRVEDERSESSYSFMDMMDDAVTFIENICYEDDPSDYANTEDQILAAIQTVTGDPYGIEMALDPDYTERFNYPTYRFTLFTGENEDTTWWSLLVFPTDDHMYVFALNTSLDYMEEEEAKELFESFASELYLSYVADEVWPFLGMWHLNGDPYAETLTIHADGTWELRNITDEEGNGGYITCQGAYSYSDNTLFLNELSDDDILEVGTAEMVGGTLKLTLTEDYEFLFDGYGQLIFEK